MSAQVCDWCGEVKQRFSGMVMANGEVGNDPRNEVDWVNTKEFGWIYICKPCISDAQYEITIINNAQ